MGKMVSKHLTTGIQVQINEFQLSIQGEIDNLPSNLIMFLDSGHAVDNF